MRGAKLFPGVSIPRKPIAYLMLSASLAGICAAGRIGPEPSSLGFTYSIDFREHSVACGDFVSDAAHRIAFQSEIS